MGRSRLCESSHNSEIPWSAKGTSTKRKEVLL